MVTTAMSLKSAEKKRKREIDEVPVHHALTPCKHCREHNKECWFAGGACVSTCINCKRAKGSMCQGTKGLLRDLQWCHNNKFRPAKDGLLPAKKAQTFKSAEVIELEVEVVETPKVMPVPQVQAPKTANAPKVTKDKGKGKALTEGTAQKPGRGFGGSGGLEEDRRGSGSTGCSPVELPEALEGHDDDEVPVLDDEARTWAQDLVVLPMMNWELMYQLLVESQQLQGVVQHLEQRFEDEIEVHNDLFNRKVVVLQKEVRKVVKEEATVAVGVETAIERVLEQMEEMQGYEDKEEPGSGSEDKEELGSGSQEGLEDGSGDEGEVEEAEQGDEQEGNTA